MRPFLAEFFEKAEAVQDSEHGTQTMTEVRREIPDADVLAESALDTQTVTKVRHEDPDQDVSLHEDTISAGTMTFTATREDLDSDPGETGTQTGTRTREEPDTDVFDRDSSHMWEATLL